MSCLQASDSGPTFLMVDFARAMDTVWEALRRAALDGLAAHALASRGAVASFDGRKCQHSNKITSVD